MEVDNINKNASSPLSPAVPPNIFSIDATNRQGRKYTEHLLSATMEAGFDLHAIPAVLLGGGASVVSRHLSPKDGLCKTIFLLDDKVNAIGFERALAAVSRRKGEA